MRTSPGLYIEWVEDEAVVLDSGSQQVHHLNPAAALAFALIEEHGFEVALQDLRERYPPQTEFGSALPALIEEMKERGLLIDD